MSDMIVLEATQRDVTGKKVKQLRREGRLPGVVYGPEMEPMKLEFDTRELRQTLLRAGGTQIVELHVGKEKIPTLARDVQRDPVRGDMLHVDFYRVSLTRKLTAQVPVVLVGESPAAASGTASVDHILTSLEIEALPTDLPPQIEVDLSMLKEAGDQIKVADLVLPAGCEAMADPEELVARAEYYEAIVEGEDDEEEGLFFDESPEVEVIRERKSDEDED